MKKSLPSTWPPPFEARFETYSAFNETATGALEGSMSWPRINQSAAFVVHPSLLSLDEVRAIRGALPESLPFEQHEDSVDGYAAHELWVWYDGEYTTQPRAGPDPGGDGRKQQMAARAALRPLLSTLMTERLAPLVTARYGRGVCGAAGCVACSSLIRRYLPSERRAHPQHFDLEALATVVVSLSLTEDEYEGGLFVHTGGQARPQMLDLHRGGAAVVHAGDLLHGVRVKSGSRWSWVTWFGNDGEGEGGAARCDSRLHARWDAAAAAAGDPIRAFLHYFRLPPGTPGRIEFLRTSAAAGFARAQNELGLVLARGAASDGLAGPNVTAAEEQFARAAADDCHAASNLALVRWRQGAHEEAVRLLGEARQMGNRRAETAYHDLVRKRSQPQRRPAARPHDERATLDARERNWLKMVYADPRRRDEL